MSKSEYVLDELLNFLGESVFQDAVKLFMEYNLAIFDPNLSEDQYFQEHYDVHKKYQKLIDDLLDAFCKDAKVSKQDVIKGLDQLSSNPDIKEVFSLYFEQIMAANDFRVFANVITRHNIVAQQQVLFLLIKKLGRLPDSMTPQDVAAVAEAAPSLDPEDEKLLKEIVKKSLEEEIKKEEAKESVQHATFAKEEAAVLENRKAELEQDFIKMGLEDKGSAMPSKPSSKAPEPAKARGSSSKGRPQGQPESGNAKNLPKVGSGITPITGAQAASSWLAAAKSENTGPSNTMALLQQMKKMSPDELAKRQAFLNSQRDKLLAMKKAKREEKLADESTARARPTSARVARNAANPTLAADPEDEKKMAMRRAIANKLKQEVIGKHS
ncbi:DgyrCDS10327 [Dimorphilus gyrociliatus]|uniref:Cilia- and flagella-associated protein 36 n=2 Tax=Dimorphilus gyrociliatus TaxID=2664684 RepID=A0A7I8VZU6_9ANNE|nr:DgyrCDS10327 [Dimorphilus gyrociliatus]